MLKFHGVHFVDQTPTRFDQYYDLRASLNICIATLKTSEQLEPRLEELNQQINQIYSQHSTSLSKEGRQKVAKISRAKDMLNFLYQEPTWLQHKQIIATILSQNMVVEKKWAKIQQHLVDQLKEQKGLALILTNPSNQIHKILQFVQLLFMDQINEAPPPNLVLKFIPNHFPVHNWLSTDEVGNVKLLNWLPKNSLCNLHFLITQIALESRRSAENFLTDLPQLPKLLADRPSSLFKQPPAQQPDEIYIKYQPPGMAKTTLLPLIEKSPQQSLISFQIMIRKQNGEEGIRHLLAALRQLSTAQQEIYDFDSLAHLNLLCKTNKSGKFPAKQVHLMQTVLQELQNLQVCRLWKSGNRVDETQIPFVCQLRTAHSKIPKTNGQWKIQLLLDKIVFPVANNQHTLGRPLQLIPSATFQESSRQQPELLLLLAYFSSCWLYEYPKNQGVLHKTAEQIIEESGSFASMSSKYRIIQKLKANLYYMKEKKYISQFSLKASRAKNPLKDEYTVKTSKDCAQLMQQAYQRISI